MNETSGTALRKEIRKSARFSLKRHYWLFVAAALLAAILGTEYGNATQTLRLKKKEPAAAEAIMTDAAAADAVNAENPADITYITDVMENPAAIANITDVMNVTGAQIALGVNEMSGVSVFNDIINGDWQSIVDAVEYRMEVLQGKETYVGDVQLGHSRGVFASIVNEFESGSLLLSLLTLYDTILGSKKLAGILFALLGFAIIVLFWLMVSNVYRAVCCRVFLEGRIYDKIPYSRFMYLHRVKKHVKASITMAIYTLLKYFWLATIVFYPVKRYAYLMVPYLVAENPDISAIEAIRLSSRMMKGHKWEAFILELTLLPWLALSIVTGGLAGILFCNPYREAVLAEYCSRIRCLAKEKKVEGTERLNDRYLFEIPAEAALTAAYQDAALNNSDARTNTEARDGIWGWLESWFGIVPFLDEREKDYRSHMQDDLKKEEYKDALEGKTYPVRLYPIREVRRRKKTDDIGYMRHYPVHAVILLFFLFSGGGWLWEVALHLVQTGEFANRGFLHGPWLPIYGSGGILILLLLYRIRQKPMTEFIYIIILCGILEYMTSWVLEMTHDGAKWWDYTGYYLNLNGRICAEGLLVFGIGGMAFVYVLAPVIDNIIEQMRMKILMPVCAALVVIFCIDAVYSGISPNIGVGVTEDAPAEAQNGG